MKSRISFIDNYSSMTTVSLSFDYVSKSISEFDFGPDKRPLIVGVSGPQGSGKTFVSDQVSRQLQQAYPELNIVQFSMDDLYLTHEDQVILTNRAKTEMDNNPLLQGRGLPGTHDIELGIEILESIIKGRASGKPSHGEPLRIPVYEKSLFAGQGDRLHESSWQIMDKPIDVVIFEGWFNGFQPLDADQLRLKFLGSTDPVLTYHKFPHLEDINQKLQNYAKIWDLFDRFVFLETTSTKNVYSWRLEQEHALKARTGIGMSDDQVVHFINRYMPVYSLYYENMCSKGVPKVPGSNLRIQINEEREVLASEIF